MKRFLLLSVLASTFPVVAQDERVEAPAGARIAFRTATSEILIIGGDYELGEGTANLSGLDQFPRQQYPGSPAKSWLGMNRAGTSPDLSCVSITRIQPAG